MTKATSSISPPIDGDRFQHRKGGTYRIIGIGNIQAGNWRDHTDRTAPVSVDMEPVVVYQAVTNGKIWVRPLAEFMDGRFTALPTPASGDLSARLRGPVRQALSRLVAGAFRRDGERLEDDRRPRFSIPARPAEDDDLLVCAAMEEAAHALDASTGMTPVPDKRKAGH